MYYFCNFLWIYSYFKIKNFFKTILQPRCSNKQILVHLPSANLWVNMTSYSHPEELRHFKRKSNLTSVHQTNLKLSIVHFVLEDAIIIKRNVWLLYPCSRFSGGDWAQVASWVGDLEPASLSLHSSGFSPQPLLAPWKQHDWVELEGQRGHCWYRQRGLISASTQKWIWGHG